MAIGYIFKYDGQGTCEQRIKGGKTVNYMDIWKMSILEKGYSLQRPWGTLKR